MQRLVRGQILERQAVPNTHGRGQTLGRSGGADEDERPQVDFGGDQASALPRVPKTRAVGEHTRCYTHENVEYRSLTQSHSQQPRSCNNFN